MTTEQLAYLNEITEANRVNYPDRYQMAVDRDVVLNLYVPAPGRVGIALPGSAIVGLPLAEDADRILIYFEGDKSKIGMNFATKVHHAADRMVTRYPTVATAVLDIDEIREVGTYNVATHAINVTDWTTFDAWRETSD